MITKKFIVGATAVTIALLSINTQQAQAGTLYQDWNYSIDSASDGSGGSGYEIQGIAIKDGGNKVYVAFNSGMPLTGNNDTNIGWSDLFFNFSGNNFQSASNSTDLFAVKFVNKNTPNFALGVYKNVEATSITLSHNGYGSLQQYYNAGYGREYTQGTDFVTKESFYQYYYGDVVANNPTTDNTPILNVMKSGTKIGGVSMLSIVQLSSLGLDFGKFGISGPETMGFSFDKSLIGDGNYVSNIFLDCGNDGIALKGNLKTTPEPTTTAGLFVMALGLFMTKRRRYLHNLLSA